MLQPIRDRKLEIEGGESKSVGWKCQARVQRRLCYTGLGLGGLAFSAVFGEEQRTASGSDHKTAPQATIAGIHHPVESGFITAFFRLLEIFFGSLFSVHPTSHRHLELLAVHRTLNNRGRAAAHHDVRSATDRQKRPAVAAGAAGGLPPATPATNGAAAAPGSRRPSPRRALPHCRCTGCTGATLPNLTESSRLFCVLPCAWLLTRTVLTNAAAARAPRPPPGCTARRVPLEPPRWRLGGHRRQPAPPRYRE